MPENKVPKMHRSLNSDLLEWIPLQVPRSCGVGLKLTRGFMGLFPPIKGPMRHGRIERDDTMDILLA